MHLHSAPGRARSSKFLFSATFPNSGIRAVLCVDAGYDLEYMRCMGIAQYNFVVDEIYC